MNSTGIVAALEQEARALGPSTHHAGGFRLVGTGTLVAVCGMGPVAAAAAAERLAAAGATALVSWGMAGGLDPNLDAGTICVPMAVIAADGRRFATDLHWRELLAAALAAHQSVVSGELLSTIHPLATVTSKAAAHVETSAVAVDMESIAVAEIAAAHELPFLAVRVIVDTALDTLPASVMMASEAGQVHLGRLVRGVLQAPREILPLIRLSKRYRAAMRSLGMVARTGALAPGAFATASGTRSGTRSGTPSGNRSGTRSGTRVA